MDKTSNSTTVPAVSTALRVSHSLSMSALASMRMRDLMTLNDVMVHIETSLLGFINQPRCQTDGSGRNNDAGQIVEALLEHIYQCGDLVIRATRDATPLSASDIEDRAWVLVRNEAKCAESLTGITAIAAREAVKLSDAQWREANSERAVGGL